MALAFVLIVLPSSVPPCARIPFPPSLALAAYVRVRRSFGFSRMAIIFHGPLDGRFQAPTAANADSTERPTTARRCNVVSQFVRPFSVPSISPRLVSPSLSPFPTSPVSLSSSANEALADKRGATTMLERGKRERQKKREREGSPTQSSSDILREAGSPCSILQRPPIRDRPSAAALH